MRARTSGPSAPALLAGALAGCLAVAVAAVACAARPPAGPAPEVALQTPPADPASLTLRVSADGRGLVDAAGEPFFWLGDTAWSLPVNLDRAEVEHYLDTRAAQGYTVIQTVAVFPQAGGAGPNRYGDRPYDDGLDDLAVTDGADPADATAYDFWDHLDYAVAAAAERGLRVALLPVWADDQVGDLVTEDNAAAYGEFVGARYADDGVVFVMGGDAPADGVEDVWRELARGVAIGATGREDYSTTLMTYHPVGDRTSADWFHDDPWLDLDMVQGGHCLRYALRAEALAATHDADPVKPFLDGEPIYEDHPYCWKPEDGFSTPLDVRRDAYWSVLAGAAGHTYGHHAVWQFTTEGRAPELGARGDWHDALGHEAGGQMRHVRALVESRGGQVFVPDEAILPSGADEGRARVAAARAGDGSFAVVYSPDGAPFEADLSVLAGPQARLWWYDPRTGAASDAGTAPAGPATFAPPSPEDWVLVADDPAAGFGPPGSVSQR